MDVEERGDEREGGGEGERQDKIFITFSEPKIFIRGNLGVFCPKNN